MASAHTVMSDAIQALELAIVPPRPGTNIGNWRFSVRQRLAEVRDAIIVEDTGTSNAWLTARNGAALRERGTLLSRLASMAGEVLERPDLEGLRAELRRLVGDVQRHAQRLNDLAYDEVELELGGGD